MLQPFLFIELSFIFFLFFSSIGLKPSSYFYGDCSGYEWKGIRQYDKNNGYGGEDTDVNNEWSDFDAQAYQKPMSYWDEFFCESEEDDIITIQDKYFDELSDNEEAWSDDFDHDTLRDCSRIWNLLTKFE